MKSTLTIKDLSLDKELGGKAMSAVRGGIAQSNATSQGNSLQMTAPVSVGNGSAFLGSGPVSFNVVSQPVQVASNASTSNNSAEWNRGFGFLGGFYL